ncbi:MAG: TIM barrel protein [Candidatus Hydrogenedentes bacterium]|nr:TIM barrel protein [Candidatus Hydrogenedentota bacterium]
MNHAASILSVSVCVVAVLMASSRAFGQTAPAGANTATPHRVYSHLMDPRENPDYERHAVKPPTWETFGNQTQFVALRGFGVDKGKMTNIVSEIDKYTKTYDLGNVIWPSYDCIFADNLGELADEVKRRGLFLFDIWGYVPGSGIGGYWQQFKAPAGVFDMLESKLGDHWLGMDNGEQDGRYIGGYASQMYPISDNRFEQFLNFHRHFERMCDELGNKMSALVSLNYGHYFLKEGIYATMGAETAQALPNGQVYYSFIRGAGKQYGVPWFGNASVWNRWGWKTYESAGADPPPPHGPTKGTSLNLLKRLMYNHILYNSMFVGFESSWFEGDKLSPIGRIQQAAQQWVRANGQPGVMMAPVALMLDFNAGWTFPRHLYTDRIYRVWGNLPYQPGDYLTDGVLDMIYPGYQDASYYHDESGFIAPTPYGDGTDCVLSDAPGWLLARYPLLIVAGELQGGAEIRDKLAAYVEAGGRVIITAGSLAKLPGGLGGITAAGTSVPANATQPVQLGGETITEGVGFTLTPLAASPDSKVLARCGDTPVAVEARTGKGSVVALASAFGVGVTSTKEKIGGGEDKPLDKPFPLLKHVRAILDGALREQVLFEAGEGLSVITCRKAPGVYTLCICNNALQPRPFKIASHCGEIESAKELPLDQSEKGAPGYLPEGTEPSSVGVSSDTTIAGGDVRVFAVRVKEERIEEISRAVPAKRVSGRVLPLRGHRTIQEEILARPTFFEHFDSVTVDWRYLHNRDAEALRKEAGWLKRQGLRIYVDLTSGLNLYPDLRLLNNSDGDYAASVAAIDGVMTKMDALGVKDLILSLHREPETNFTHEQSEASFEACLREFAKRAASRKVALYLRTSPKGGERLDQVRALLDRVAAPNVTLAPSTALLLDQNVAPDAAAKLLEGRIGLWLVSASARDIAGSVWTGNLPIAGQAAAASLAPLLALNPGAPVVLDAVYANPDEEYLDVRELDRVLGR